MSQRPVLGRDGHGYLDGAGDGERIRPRMRMRTQDDLLARHAEGAGLRAALLQDGRGAGEALGQIGHLGDFALQDPREAVLLEQRAEERDGGGDDDDVELDGDPLDVVAEVVCVALVIYNVGKVVRRLCSQV